MVQQISLYTCTSTDQLALIKSTLSALSGTPPLKFANCNIVTKPNPSYDIVRMNAKQQLIESSRLRFSTNLSLETTHVDVESILNTRQHFSLIQVDPALPQKKPIMLQIVSEALLVANNGLKEWIGELGYTVDFVWCGSGWRWAIGNIIIEIYKIYSIDAEAVVAEEKSDDPLRGASGLKDVTAGGFMVKAYVNVARNTDIELVGKGIADLEKFKSDISGLLDMGVVDRAVLDMRVM